MALNQLSDRLASGSVYTREQLKGVIETQDATLNTGVFRPAGFDSVLLFVTEKKTPDRVQYLDKLEGDILHWQGQNAGRTDVWIVEHRARDLELLLFYRTKKYEYPGAGFKYEGLFDYVSHEGALPASFTLRRVDQAQAQAELEAESEAEVRLEESGAFDPASIEDARKKTFAAIVMRQGQPAFRRKLLEAYESRCALSDCPVEEVLEAAHICRYMGEDTNVVENGLLLRADLHTLYDRALIAIHPATHAVSIAPELADSEYGSFAGRVLRPPKNPEHRPSSQALHAHWMLVRSIWEKRS
ncbi:hypothetical protein AWB76_06142 [Caballeronia temeraria]|uniref:HNH nuclease domain-containing protein n=1 Tax=Caballeronia temeraria TaxID=1777137 RepID=A0A158CXY5_9BURK|nr:HNH endonuclease signature motif containing protein [Caballeronia temeraria]SAK87204.1 hypothetical protein AWB76_06142 [Caballeronia temeraria]